MTKAVLCYGDSLTWGYNPESKGRFAWTVRWPGVVQARLADRARIIEEGLCGRAASTESWILPHRDGRAMLPPLLETHAPIDVVILFLGANDSGPSYRRSAGDIAFGIASMIWTIQKSMAGPGGAIPAILIVCPPRLGRPVGMMELFFEEGAAETLVALPAAYRTVTAETGAHFFDAGEHVSASPIDGVHLDAGAHAVLGEALAARLEPLL